MWWQGFFFFFFGDAQPSSVHHRVRVGRAVWGSPSVHPYTILSVVVPLQKNINTIIINCVCCIFPMDLSVIFSLYYYYYHYYYYLKETCISLSFQLSLFLLLLHHDRSLLLIYILYITLHHMAPFNLCDLCIFFFAFGIILFNLLTSLMFFCVSLINLFNK